MSEKTTCPDGPSRSSAPNARRPSPVPTSSTVSPGRSWALSSTVSRTGYKNSRRSFSRYTSSPPNRTSRSHRCHRSGLSAMTGYSARRRGWSASKALMARRARWCMSVRGARRRALRRRRRAAVRCGWAPRFRSRVSRVGHLRGRSVSPSADRRIYRGVRAKASGQRRCSAHWIGGHDHPYYVSRPYRTRGRLTKCRSPEAMSYAHLTGSAGCCGSGTSGCYGSASRSARSGTRWRWSECRCWRPRSCMPRPLRWQR